MALPVNNKKSGNANQKMNQNQGKGSKFIKGGAGTKPAGTAKKVRSTGANRGS